MKKKSVPELLEEIDIEIKKIMSMVPLLTAILESLPTPYHLDQKFYEVKSLSANADRTLH